MTSNSVTKAVRATVKFGSIELDCLQFPDGSYHFYVNQIRENLQIQAANQTGKKYLKPLLDANPKQLTSAKIEGSKSALKTFSLDLVAQAIGIYAELGNQTCIKIAIACVAESLERRADNAFSVVRTEQERNDRIEHRVIHADGWRKLFTDWQKQDGCKEGWEYAARVNELKVAAGLPTDTIEMYDAKQVQRMVNAEVIYDAMRRAGKSHQAALQVI